jgi:hypothetical protein
MLKSIAMIELPSLLGLQLTGAGVTPMATHEKPGMNAM